MLLPGMYEESGMPVTRVVWEELYRNAPQSQNIFPLNFSKIQDNSK
jgi:hypothetical protein